MCVFVPSDLHTKSQVHTQTHKPDKTKININGFGMAKSAVQLLFGPLLVLKLSNPFKNFQVQIHSKSFQFQIITISN